jgi:predicted amidohydrolase
MEALRSAVASDLPDQPVVVQHWEGEVAPAATSRGLVHLEGVFEAEQPLGADDYLAATGREEVEVALAGLRAVVARQRCHCLVGTARYVAGRWRNSAALVSPAGEMWSYDKHTLSSLDSRHFVAGDELSVYAVNDVTAGVQICWELLFPWQWAQLKRDGAQVVFHVNNAVKPEDAFWEHVLLTRAFENRSFVCSVNNAAATQTLPSYVIAPSGDPLLTSEPRVEQALACEIDLSQVEPTWS